MAYRNNVTEGIFTALPKSLTHISIVNSKMSDNCLRSLSSTIREGKIWNVCLEGNSFRDIRQILDALSNKKSIALNVTNCNLPAA